MHTGGKTQKQKEKVDSKKIPSFCVCPVTMEIMRDPVIVDAPCKHTCSRQAMERWLVREEAAATCPICGIELTSSQLSPNSMLRDAITSTVGEDEKIPIRLKFLSGQEYSWRASKQALWKNELKFVGSYDVIDRVIYKGRLLCPEARVDGIGFADNDIEQNVCHGIVALSCGLKPPTTVVQSVEYRLGTTRQKELCDISFSPQCQKTRHAERLEVKCQWCGCLPYSKLLVERKCLHMMPKRRWTGRLTSSFSIDIGLKRVSYPGQQDIFWLDFDQFHSPDDTFKVMKVGSSGSEEILGSLRGPSEEGSWDSFAVPTITWTAEQPLEIGEYLVRFEEERLPWQGDHGNKIGRSEWSFEIF